MAVLTDDVVSRLQSLGFTRKRNRFIWLRPQLPILVMESRSKVDKSSRDLIALLGPSNSTDPEEWGLHQFSQALSAGVRSGYYTSPAQLEKDFTAVTLPFLQLTDTPQSLCDRLLNSELLPSYSSRPDEVATARDVFRIASSYELSDRRAAAVDLAREVSEKRSRRADVEFMAEQVGMPL